MKGLIFSLVAIALLLVAAGEASAVGFHVRRTPLNPFRGPVVVGGHHSGGFNNGAVVSRGVNNGRFVTVIDRNGNQITRDRATGAKFINGVRVR